MNSKFLTRSALCLALTLTACSNQQEPAAEATTNEKSAPAVAAQQQDAPVVAAPAQAVISGTVLETMNAAGYTYLQVDTGTDQPWVAIPETQLAVGDQVSYRQGMVMKNFPSKSLDRTFESIVFSSGLINPAAINEEQAALSKDIAITSAAAPLATNTPDSFADAIKGEGGQQQNEAQMESGGSLAAMTPFASISVPRAEGENSQTVSDIFANKDQLDGKKVRIQGKVIKFSPMIMGKNWIHIQDGSGDPLQNSHDLVVTTNDTPGESEIITIEGTVRANQDFGFGYKYDVLVDEAVIITQ